jgi:hypothetical protein
MTPWRLPSGLQHGIAFIIQDDWSPQQALAVVELLDDLREVICNRYQLELFERLREQHDSPAASASTRIDETDPPF